MNFTLLKFLIVPLLMVCSRQVEAYYVTHPPYFFDQDQYRYVSGNALGDHDIPLFIKESMDFSYSKYQIFKADVDGNGKQDFIVFIYSGRNSLVNEFHMYLKKTEMGYRKISFTQAVGAGIEDIVDINRDGQWEVILTNLYVRKNENFFVYNVYAFKDFRLVNSDHLFKNFPKFVLFTEGANDQDDVNIKKQDKDKFIEEKNASIQYEDIDF